MISTAAEQSKKVKASGRPGVSLIDLEYPQKRGIRIASYPRKIDMVFTCGDTDRWMDGWMEITTAYRNRNDLLIKYDRMTYVW